jgi:hypothetical protein
MSHTEQASYLYACRTEGKREEEEKKKKKKKKSDASGRNKNKKRKFYEWSLPIDGNVQRVKVCQGAVRGIFDVSRGRLSNLENIVKHGDQRGVKKENFKKSEVTQKIKEHIRAIPKHKSHYNRKKCPKRMYINRDEVKTVSDMWSLFMKRHTDEPHLHCSYDFYRNIFQTFNIGFKVNSTDECGECQKAKAQNKTRTRKHKRHLLLAKKAREESKNDAETSNERTFVGARDLKSVTDIPKLTHGEMFYKRA